MKSYIGKYDKTEAFMALIEVLEIRGENKLINQMQNEAITVFKNTYTGEMNIDWVIGLVLESRKDIREKLSKK